MQSSLVVTGIQFLLLSYSLLLRNTSITAFEFFTGENRGESGVAGLSA